MSKAGSPQDRFWSRYVVPQIQRRSLSRSNCQPTDPLGVAQVADAVAGPVADHRNGPIVLGVEWFARAVHAVAVEIDVP